MKFKDSAYNPLPDILSFWPLDPIEVTMKHIDALAILLARGGIEIETSDELDEVLTLLHNLITDYRTNNGN